MKNQVHKNPETRRLTGVLLAAVAVAMSLCGCTSRLARENILANTETAYGLTVAENPQTQIPELKLGYARHELFYVPSSKTLIYKDPGKSIGGEVADAAANSGDPSRTPQVLAEIAIGSGVGRSGSGGGATNGMNFRVRQRLAVGVEAVRAPAAGVLMASGDAQAAELLRNLSVSSFAQQEDLKRGLLAYYFPGGVLDQGKAGELRATIAKVLKEQQIAVPSDLELSDFIHGENHARLRELVAARLGIGTK